MRPRDHGELLALGALWGASFVFMRQGAAEFGPFALVFLRVGVAAALLLPVLGWQGELRSLVQHWRVLLVLGLLNSALPFLLWVVGAYVLSAGALSVFNATAPIWTALVAWLWLAEQPAAFKLLGLALGLTGAVVLAWTQIGIKAQAPAGITPAIGVAASLGAALLYGIAANFARRRLTGVPPMAMAVGSQLGAAVLLLLPALVWWPTTPPSAAAWGSAMALAVACTALAYVLYFRLVSHAGATQAVTVTFLIPVFAMLWGWLLLSETPTPAMLLGCGAILLGTAITTGLLRAPAR
jgi:drug/metabolite transporter (DMT)-like permease